MLCPKRNGTILTKRKLTDLTQTLGYLLEHKETDVTRFQHSSINLCSLQRSHLQILNFGFHKKIKKSVSKYLIAQYIVAAERGNSFEHHQIWYAPRRKKI